MVIMMRNMMWQVDFDRLNIEKVRNNQKPNRIYENKSQIGEDKMIKLTEDEILNNKIKSIELRIKSLDVALDILIQDRNELVKTLNVLRC